jgi:hypothetical protein
MVTICVGVYEVVPAVNVTVGAGFVAVELIDPYRLELPFQFVSPA